MKRRHLYITILYVSTLTLNALAQCTDLITYLETTFSPIRVPFKQIKYIPDYQVVHKAQQPEVETYRNNLRRFQRKIKKMIGHRETSLVVYPAGGFDLATVDLLFPNSKTTVIINMVGQFLLPEHLTGSEDMIYNKEKIQSHGTWGLTVTHYAYLSQQVSQRGILPLLLGRQKRFFGSYFKPLSITAYPEKNDVCHGCLTYTLGSQKTPQTLIYIHGRLDHYQVEQNVKRPAIKINRDLITFIELPHHYLSTTDVLLVKGSMGHLVFEENLSTIIQSLKHNQGLLVEGKSGHLDHWEISETFLNPRTLIQSKENRNPNGMVRVELRPQILPAKWLDHIVDQAVDLTIPFSYAKGIQATRLKD